MKVYRWDLDKTYLQTDFESFRGLVRSATESARDKRAVPGATELLRELSREHDGVRPRVVLLSGSPTQMRRVLEQKLRLDGIRFDEFHLKDNLRNLRHGRVRAIRDQFGYKLPRLLGSRAEGHPDATEWLFGDDAEADAIVYSLYADAIAGRVSPAELSRVMEQAGAYADHIVDALAALRRVEQRDAVARIFIRMDRGVERRPYALLGTRVTPVRTWFEAATVLLADGELAWPAWRRVFVTSPLVDAEAVRAVAGLLDRGVVDAPRLAHALAAAPRESPLEEVRALAEASSSPYSPPRPPPAPDWLEIMKQWEKKPKAAGSRLRSFGHSGVGTFTSS